MCKSNTSHTQTSCIANSMQPLILKVTNFSRTQIFVHNWHIVGNCSHFQYIGKFLTFDHSSIDTKSLKILAWQQEFSMFAKINSWSSGLSFQQTSTQQRQEDMVPDGGYGWIVCLLGSLMHTFTEGSATSFGVILAPYATHYGTTLAVMSLDGSLLLAIEFLFLKYKLII